jgi:hypothetical protein
MKDALKVLLCKMESTYGVDSVPTNLANVIVAQNVDINPLEMETDDYTPVSDTFGSNEMIVGAVWSTISFDVLLCGGGTPLGTPPNHGPLLRACGWAQTVHGTTDVTYGLVSKGEESICMYYYMDGVLQKMLGIRGSISENWQARKAPRMTFKGIGLNVPMIDAALPVPTLPTIPRPMAMNKANTVLTIGGYAARLSSFTIDQNNDVQYRNLTGREDVSIVGRNMSGKVVVELPLVAEKDFLGAAGLCTLATPSAMSIVHGTAAGNIITRTLPRVQLMKPKPRVEQGVLMLECDLHIARNAGNDEMTSLYT